MVARRAHAAAIAGAGGGAAASGAGGHAHRQLLPFAAPAASGRSLPKKAWPGTMTPTLRRGHMPSGLANGEHLII